MTLMRFTADTPAFYSAFQVGERSGGLLISHPIYTGSFFGFSGLLEEVLFLGSSHICKNTSSSSFLLILSS
jgi:hypothetical protein